MAEGELNGLPASAGTEAPMKERTILLVDDEENILAAMKRVLRREGYRILTAGGGQQGLELLAANEVDVIVSDQRMPNMTGVEFLRRAKVTHPETVRIVLSGYTELQSITDAINEGAIYKFLTKPWDDDQIRANIAEAFQHKEMVEDNRRLAAQLAVANEELADANARLKTLLAAKQHQLSVDEASLDIAREVLHCVALPIIGVDDCDMIVFANAEADSLLGNGVPLLAENAQERLPEVIVSGLQGGDGDVYWDTPNGSYRIVCRNMGQHSRSPRAPADRDA